MITRQQIRKTSGDLTASVEPIKKVNGRIDKAMHVDKSLEKFSSDEFTPEKYKDDDARFAKSTIPDF